MYIDCVVQLYFVGSSKNVSFRCVEWPTSSLFVSASSLERGHPDSGFVQATSTVRFLRFEKKENKDAPEKLSH